MSNRYFHRDPNNAGNFVYVMFLPGLCTPSLMPKGELIQWYVSFLLTTVIKAFFAFYFSTYLKLCFNY